VLKDEVYFERICRRVAVDAGCWLCYREFVKSPFDISSHLSHLTFGAVRDVDFVELMTTILGLHGRR